VVRSLQKTRLNKLAHHLYYRYIHGFDSADRAVLPALEASFQTSIERGLADNGGYFEFGVFKGYTFWYAQNLARKHGLEGMQFYGFDSFTGLPPVRGRDQTPDDEFYEGQYACSKEKVVANLDAQGVDWSRTHLVEGYFEHSLNDELKAQLRQQRIAIALIDCDLYESTVFVLNFIEDLIADGTILLFDDWNCFNADGRRGQRKAFADFLERNGQLSAQAMFAYGRYGQVFTMRTSRSRSRRRRPAERPLFWPSVVAGLPQLPVMFC
jgi:hypothetical protein